MRATAARLCRIDQTLGRAEHIVKSAERQAEYYRKGGIMKRRKLALMSIIVGAVAVCTAAPAFGQDFAQQVGSGQGNVVIVVPQNSALRILNPLAGQVVASDSVTVRFKLVRPNPTGSGSDFVLQIDDRDPVKTSDMEYALTGLRAGQHSVSVTEVDANGTPQPGTTAVVQFVARPPEVAVPPAPSEAQPAQPSGPVTQSPALRILSPLPGQLLTNNFVNVRFKLLRFDSSGGGSDFVLQLDGRDPVRISATSYAFTGLRSGEHVLTITKMDANGTALPASRAVVKFGVKPR
jgi:hypothetical protein